MHVGKGRLLPLSADLVRRPQQDSDGDAIHSMSLDHSTQPAFTDGPADGRNIDADSQPPAPLASISEKRLKTLVEDRYARPWRGVMHGDGHYHQKYWLEREIDPASPGRLPEHSGEPLSLKDFYVFF